MKSFGGGEDYSKYSLILLSFPLKTDEYCRLGMESGAIADQQITASSIWNHSYNPWTARLNNVPNGSSLGEWVPSQGKLFCHLNFINRTVFYPLSGHVHGSPPLLKRIYIIFKLPPTFYASTRSLGFSYP